MDELVVFELTCSYCAKGFVLVPTVNQSSEIFYHAPMLVAEWLKSNNNFTQAKRWYEYVFNPNAPNRDGDKRFWRFRPFREDMTLPGLEQVLTNTFEINQSNKDPFDPHAIARLRISAYAKSTVQCYIDDLIRWADALFTADTRETINQATNLYVLAGDLLGVEPEVVGVFKQPVTLTFNQIKERYPHGIPQYLIDLENTRFLPPTGQSHRYADVPVNDIHAYFGMPDNEKLRDYWATIDDRLFKILLAASPSNVLTSSASSLLLAWPAWPAAWPTWLPDTWATGAFASHRSRRSRRRCPYSRRRSRAPRARELRASSWQTHRARPGPTSPTPKLPRSFTESPGPRWYQLRIREHRRRSRGDVGLARRAQSPTP